MTRLSQSFTAFFDSEKSSGLLLIACTAVSIALANSIIGLAYIDFLHLSVGGLSIEHWINDWLMAIFFLHIGLELEREVYNGELSKFRQVLLPVVAAIGGICFLYKCKSPKLLPSCLAGSIMPALRITGATETHRVDSPLFALGQSAIQSN